MPFSRMLHLFQFLSSLVVLAHTLLQLGKELMPDETINRCGLMYDPSPKNLLGKYGTSDHSSEAANEAYPRTSVGTHQRQE